MYMYVHGRTGHVFYYNGEIRVEKGKRKLYIYAYTCILGLLPVLKKEAIGMANTHKKQRRQDRDGLVMMAR